MVGCVDSPLPVRCVPASPPSPKPWEAQTCSISPSFLTFYDDSYRNAGGEAAPRQKTPGPRTEDTNRLVSLRQPCRVPATANGCRWCSTTCRRRHLKCDEVTPCCGACTKSGHECVYANRDEARPGQVVQQESESPPRPPDFSEQTFSLAENLELNSAISPEQVFDSALQNHAQYDETDAAATALPVTTTARDDSTASPGDSSYTGVSSATARWFGLLLDDAALGLEIDAGNAFQLAAGDALLRSTNPLDSDSAPHFSPVQSSHVNEHALWQCPERLSLLPTQCLAFENFVRRVACWLDLFDLESHFSVLVPRLAVGFVQFNIGTKTCM